MKKITVKNDNKSAHSSYEYDSQIVNTIPNYEIILNAVLMIVKASGIEIGNWLDTGCGTGTLIRRAFDIFPGASFIFADPSAEMIAQSKIKIDNLRGRFRFLPPVTTQELRINDKCDVITAIQCHHYLDYKTRLDAVKICYDMLNKDGIFITTENISPMTETGIRIGKEVWKNFQISRGKPAVEAEDHLDRFGKEYFPLTIEEHLKLYRNCGFKIVEIFWYSGMQAGFYCVK
jgi:tRNA (cmo5U34)-methyltransferase